MNFRKANKKACKARLALVGPPGSGKTYTALTVGMVLAGERGRIAVIDTERGSASKYSDEFDFDVVELDSYAPATFVDLIHQAEANGYAVLIIDSLSHAWNGTDGMLEQVDKIAKRNKSGNTFQAWGDAGPQERGLWDAMLGCSMHVIATMRTKTAYVIDEVEGRDGRKRSVPRKVGMQPVQRADVEFEFDLVGDLDTEQTLVITKSRCKALTGHVVRHAGVPFAEEFKAWLEGGAVARETEPCSTSGAAQPLSKQAPKVDTPEPAGPNGRVDRKALMNEILACAKRLDVGNDTIKHNVNIFGFGSAKDMTNEVLITFAALWQKVDHLHATGSLEGYNVADELQAVPDDGTDPLSALIAKALDPDTTEQPHV